MEGKGKTIRRRSIVQTRIIGHILWTRLNILPRGGYIIYIFAKFVERQSFNEILNTKKTDIFFIQQKSRLNYQLWFSMYAFTILMNSFFEYANYSWLGSLFKNSFVISFMAAFCFTINALDGIITQKQVQLIWMNFYFS